MIDEMNLPTRSCEWCWSQFWPGTGESYSEVDTQRAWPGGGPTIMHTECAAEFKKAWP